ncbi:ankyrin repeat-containing domain protein, partial [Cercophora scortea]
MTQRKETALHWAAFYQHHGVVGILIKHNADADICDCDGKTALHKAVMREDVASVQALLKARRINVDAEDAQLWTPLRWAAAYGNHTLIEILISQGKAKVDLQDRDAYTALRWAAKNGHRQAIDALIKHGASPDVPCT